MERVASGGGTVQTQDDGGLGRTGLLDALVTLVEHGLNLTPGSTCDNDVANLQRTIRHEDGRHIATTLVERRLDDGTRSLAIGVSLQVEHLGLEEHFFQQLIDTLSLLGRNLLPSPHESYRGWHPAYQSY